MNSTIYPSLAPLNGEKFPQYRQYQSFTSPERVEWLGRNEGDAERVIRSVYCQVLGNAHVMDSERLVEAESQFINGTSSVRDFVRAVALSDLYRSRFFDGCSNNRFIELNFKHLLGRTPQGYDDFASHGRLLTEQGYRAEINSYIDSDEYISTFGEDIVPYYQGYGSPVGQKLVGFTHMFAVLRGNASSDLAQGTTARLEQVALKEQASKIVPPTTPKLAWQTNSRRTMIATDVQGLLNKALNISQPPLDAKGVVKSEPQVVAEGKVDSDRYRQYQGYQAFENTPIFELVPGTWEGNDAVNTVIRAVYRQVLGNAYVMDSERLVGPESQLKGGEISVREFVRQVAKSELYRSRFFTSCYRYRSIELNFKHLLGRAPDNYQEMVPHSDILDRYGYEADIDSYIDSDEYQNAFGEYTVPYYRYKTRNGQSMLGFTNTFGLLASASSSDKDLKTGNGPRVMTAIMLNSPYGVAKLTDAKSLVEDALRRTSFSFTVSSEEAKQMTAEEKVLTAKCKEQEQTIAQLEKQLADLRPMASFGAISTPKTTTVSDAAPNSSSTASIIAMFPKSEFEKLQEKAAQQDARIAQLEKQIGEARSLSSVAEYRLNTWRQRSF